jgi:hypothetical protein
VCAALSRAARVRGIRTGLPPCRSALLWRRRNGDARVAAFAAYAGALASDVQSTTHAAVR